MYSRKLYATGSATANGVATLTIPSASRLVAIDWAVNFDSITDNGICTLELSVASATEIAINASQQCIAELRYQSNFVTSGLLNGAVNKWTPMPGVPFAQGQFLYLHAVISGTIVYTGGAVCWFV